MSWHCSQGGGGGILGGVLLGWTTVAAVEIERYPREVLLARQRDGLLPHFPVWDDIRTFDGKPWRGVVDVVSGGFPCQDISCAGKGAGIDGERSGLWHEMCRVIGEVRPRFAFMENSPLLVSRGLDRVLGGLAEVGYHAAWTCLSALDCGAPHIRERIWILAADSDSARREAGTPCPEQDAARLAMSDGSCALSAWGRPDARRFWRAEPNVGRVGHGLAARVDRLKAIGNGQVPVVAATAFLALQRELERNYHG